MCRPNRGSWISNSPRASLQFSMIVCCWRCRWLALVPFPCPCSRDPRGFSDQTAANTAEEHRPRLGRHARSRARTSRRGARSPVFPGRRAGGWVLNPGARSLMCPAGPWLKRPKTGLRTGSGLFHFGLVLALRSVHDAARRGTPLPTLAGGECALRTARARAGSAWREGGGDGRAPPHAPPAFVYAACTCRSLSERHHPLSGGARRGPDGSSLSLCPSTGVVAYPCRGPCEAAVQARGHGERPPFASSGYRGRRHVA